MPVTPELAGAVEEALVAQSSGRLQPQLGGHLSGRLRFGAIALEAELAATGAGVETETRVWTGVTLRPAILVDAELRRGPFAAALAIGPALGLTYTAWDGVDPWWRLEPGARVRAECRWALSAPLSLSVGLGAMVKVGGPDLDLGLGLRWSP